MLNYLAVNFADIVGNIGNISEIIVAIITLLTFILTFKSQLHINSWWTKVIVIALSTFILILTFHFFDQFISNKQVKINNTDVKQFKSDVEVKICGSTTLGEDFALRYIQEISNKNNADVTTKNKGTVVDADFTGVPDNMIPDEVFRNSRVRFIIDAKGTGDGFQRLSEGNCNVSMASTSAYTENRDNEENLERILVGKDAIAVIINSNNGIEVLEHDNDEDRNTIKKIFTGQEKGWNVFYRKKSGTADTVKRHLGFNNGEQFQGTLVKSNDEMFNKVQNEPNSIGFLSMSFLRRKKFIDESNYKCISERSCEMIRDLYLYILKDLDLNNSKNKIAKTIFDYGRDKLVEEMIRAAGFVPINENIPPVPITIKDTYKILYHSNIEPIKTIEFGEGSHYLTQEAEEELEKLPNNVELVIIGHTSSTGGFSDNNSLSWERTKTVRKKLYDMGFARDSIKIYGFADKFHLPNTQPNDPKNRRVEIYNYKTFIEKEKDDS